MERGGGGGGGGSVVGSKGLSLFQSWRSEEPDDSSMSDL